MKFTIEELTNFPARYGGQDLNNFPLEEQVYYLKKLYNQVEDELDLLSSRMRMKWISVKDDFPDRSIPVLCLGFVVQNKVFMAVATIEFNKDKNEVAAYCIHEANNIFFETLCDYCENRICLCPTAMTVTHWMPLPTQDHE